MYSFSDDVQYNSQSYQQQMHRQPCIEAYGRTDTAQIGRTARDTYSRTPSPADSGVDSGLATSPDGSPRDGPGVKDAVNQTLATLSATSAMLVKPGASTEKPTHSFLALVSMAILSSPDRKLLLGDIYQYVMDNFPYYNNDQKPWRNCIRHNLSLNECFIKAGRSDCGKGNYWAIHPAVEADFAKGDFRRRQARRKSRQNIKTINDVMPTPEADSYVAMTPSHVGYHPYSTTIGYPQHATYAPAHHVATSSVEQQTTSEATPQPLNYKYTPIAGHHDIYRRAVYQPKPANSQQTAPLTSTPKSQSSSHSTRRRKLTLA